MPNLSPFFCYYGGKWRAAPRYPDPEHDIIVEPFAGAAGYATRHADRKVILVEKDPVIAGLWRYLTSVSKDEILSLPLEVPATVDDLDVCQEARWLIGFWLNKGMVAPNKRPSSWMKSGNSTFWGPVIRQRIATQIEAIRHWRIIEGEYSSAPDVEATWFIDPPYHESGRVYRTKFSEFEALANWCRSRSGQVMVCEQEGASWLPFKPFASIQSNPSPKGKRRSREVIWLSQ